MSRCFPFPPPGYEIKSKCDNASLITKGKQKKKKHKEKKDEDKKVRGDRKENRRSENKHKEGKDPNNKKHKDKKHKKDKQKDERRFSEEKKIAMLFENQDDHNLNPNSKYCNGIWEDKFVDEMGRRIRNDGEAANNEMVWKADFPAGVDDGSNCVLSELYSNINDKKERTKMDNGGSLKGHPMCLGHDMVVNNLFEENQNRITVNVGSCQLDKVENGEKGKEQSSKEDGHKSEDRYENRKGNKTKECGKEKIKQRPTARNSPEFCDNNPKDLMANHDSQGKLPKLSEPVSTVFLHINEHQANSPAKTALSDHQVSQNGNGFHPASQNSINLAVKRDDFTKNQKFNAKLLLSQAVNKNVGNMESAHSANNSTTDNGSTTVYSHTVSNGLISSHLTSIGRKTEQHRPSNGMTKVEPIVNSHNAGGKFPEPCSLIRNGRKMVGIDVEGGRMNGKLECKTDTSLKPLSKEKVSTPVKSPHPDLKYLSQILTVPVLEWSQFDDQVWLFGRLDSPAKKPKLASTQISLTKPVWTEAIRVESADVIAMPYVVPY